MKMKKVIAALLMTTMIAQSSFVAMAEEITTAPESAVETVEDVITDSMEEVTEEAETREIVPDSTEEVTEEAETREIVSDAKQKISFRDSQKFVANITPSGVCKNEFDVSYIKTPHNYYDETNSSWTISQPGASYISITFDSKTHTEKDYDFIILTAYKNGSYVTSEAYSGTTLAGKTVTYEADQLVVDFQSDIVDSYYGFELTKGVAYYAKHSDRVISADDTTQLVECDRCHSKRTVITGFGIDLSTSDTTSATIKWNAVLFPSATYKIYRSLDGKNYELLKDIARGTSVYKDNSAIPGKTYYYKIRAYENNLVLDETDAKSIKIQKLAVPTVKAALASAGVKISYNKINRATGYQISYATSETGTYKSVKTTSDLSYVQTSGISVGKTYYYKVRAYKTISGTKYYGSWSSPKKYTIKKPTLSATTLKVYEKLTATLTISGGYGTTTWATSDKTIATVSSKGVVTGKKAGTVTITATRNGIKKKCTVTVKKNQSVYNISKNINDYDWGELTMEISKIYYSGNNLVAEIYLFNPDSYSAKKFNYWDIEIYDYNEKLIARRRITNYNIGLGPNKSKKVTITFSGSQVKKTNAKLYKNTSWESQWEYVYQ